MSNTDDKDPKLPEGYEHVEERLNVTLHQVQQIDNRLKNTPKERGPRPEYKPPHYVGSLVPGIRDKARIVLQENQYQLKMDALSKTEADTRNAKGRDGRIVRDTVLENLFPNPYRQLSPEELEQERHTIKEMEQSQEYMDAKLVERAAQRDTPPEPDKPAANKNSKSDMSMSARFSMSLAFSKATDKNGGPSGKSREPDPEPDKN